MGRNETWRTKNGLWRKLRPAARVMRHEPTEAEKVLWQRLRRQGLDGVHFRRQHALDRFVVDFYAPAFKLAIEVDGTVHEARQQEDAIRDEHLRQLGVAVLRLSNETVLDDLPSALEHIRGAIAQRQQAAAE